MKKVYSNSVNYQEMAYLLIREKFPIFVFGFAVMLFFVLGAVRSIPLRFLHRPAKSTNNLTVVPLRIYRVQQGDDLWSIAERIYGSGFNAMDIAKLNRLSIPYTLTENQVLVLPSIEPKAPTQGDLTEKAAQTRRVSEYVVLEGDFLWQIAEKVYGDGNQMSKLIEKNNIPYPYNVEVGQTLLVP